MSTDPIQYTLQPDDQLFFLHIPKTAGTTLITLLDQHFAPDEICPFQLASEMHKYSPEALRKYRLFRGHLDYDFYKLLRHKPIYITMLREPVDRIISLYEFWKRNTENWVRNHPAYEDIFRVAISGSLHDFVVQSDGLEVLRLQVENNQVRRIVSNNYDPLRHLSVEAALEIAKKRLAEEFLFFGLQERFNESLDLLCYTLGWQPIKTYERRMVAPARLKRDEIPSETLDAIVERNQLDIELYQYAWDLFDQRYRNMTHRLLDEHFEGHFPELHPVQEHVELTFDQPIQGESWHSAEKNEQGIAFRWSGPDARSELNLRLAPRHDYTIMIHILNSITASQLSSLKLYVNDSKILLLQVAGGTRSGVVRGIIPRQVVEKNRTLTRLTFEIDQTVQPNEADDRRLGLAFSKLTLAPVRLLSGTELKQLIQSRTSPSAQTLQS